MDTDALSNALAKFTEAHKTAFNTISNRQSQLLELGAMIGVEMHYRSNDFATSITCPPGTSSFLVKTNTRGHPGKYSFIQMEKSGFTCEAHMNLLTRGAHDTGVYCVDVAIVAAGSVPRMAKRGEKWKCIENNSLITFAEVKRLIVYPMLLAQFIGIVHEIKPDFLGSADPRFGQKGELPPTLVALGHFSGNARAIVQAYSARHFCLCIAENFDVRLAAHRSGKARSPLYWDCETP